MVPSMIFNKNYIYDCLVEACTHAVQLTQYANVWILQMLNNKQKIFELIKYLFISVIIQTDDCIF